MNRSHSAAGSALVAIVAVLVGVLGSLVFLQTASNAANASVSIQNYTYSPGIVTITVGASVTWTNRDSVEHTVTSLTGPAGFDSGQISPGGAYAHRFTLAGTYTYHCADHSMMPTATVKVLPALSPSPTPTTHPTTHTTPRPPPHVTSTPAPRASTHVTVALAVAPVRTTPAASPSASHSVTVTKSPTPHLTAAPSASLPTTSVSSVSPTSAGSGPRAPLWWIVGAVVLVAGGAGLFLRRHGRGGQ